MRVKNFHDAWYAPNNAVLVVVGDQVRAAFARRLRPADLVRVAQGPKPK
jgi:predicted Zn-dependent peptidase